MRFETACFFRAASGLTHEEVVHRELTPMELFARDVRPRFLA
jgi:hypothetical protein